jgi:transcriptional regulator with XRE-family HTH domain
VLYVKFVRLERQLSLSELGHTLDLSYSLLSKIEKGRVNPTADELKSIAKALGVTRPECLLEHVSASPLGDGAEFKDAQREKQAK